MARYYDEIDYEALAVPDAWASPTVWRRHHRAMRRAQAAPIPEMMEARHGKPAEGMEWYYVNGDDSRAPQQRPKTKPGPKPMPLTPDTIAKVAVQRREAVYDPDGSVAVYARNDDKFVAVRTEVENDQRLPKNRTPLYKVGRPKRDEHGRINFREVEVVLSIVGTRLAIKKVFAALGDVDVESLYGHPRIDPYGTPKSQRAEYTNAEIDAAIERGDISIPDD